MTDFYLSALKHLKKNNLHRSLDESEVIDAVAIKRGQKKLISFSSNDYFGLSQNLQVKKAAIAAIKKFGVGGRASRYVSGNNSLYTKLEKNLARIKNCDDSIVFTSGYSASIGVIPALVSEGDLIVADRLIHSSLIDGTKLSGARLMRFQHNDILHCKEILTTNRGKFKKCLIITETVFSMDGDVGEVEKLLELADQFNCLLVSDAAHDLFFKKNSMAKNHLQMGTLSKAVGSLGGYVAGDKILIEYLRNFSKSQIYSTALPPCVLEASIQSLKIIEQKNLGAKALKNAEYFCDLMKLPKPQSAIVPIILGDNEKVLVISEKLKEKGFLISAIRPPTVEVNKARLRITFCAMHKKNQIKNLAEILQKILLSAKKQLKN